MTLDEFINNTKLLGIDVNKEQLDKLSIYASFLMEYNAHTNLTAIKTIEEIYLKHFYDSLTLTKVIDLNSATICSTVTDVKKESIKEKEQKINKKKSVKK